ncbi:MAG: hypothetical protein GXO16_01840 [Epsilonproteobacteria bacterium]|nr:hypothetical protein [Campylobacterota bacterium]
MRYQLRLKVLSPVHIGTGESYEPTNFMIDEERKNGKISYWLYEFDEREFFEKLDQRGRKEFLEAVELGRSESLFRIHRLVKNNAHIAKSISKGKRQVCERVGEAYQEKIGRVVQRKGRSRGHKRSAGLIYLLT